ncbi:MAG: hypothetical protein EHM41_01645 [Chloroflexi bacterium]|nr:MAG: hypothetical protein EHM41_01645 [Chloroflexota bacterium]
MNSMILPGFNIHPLWVKFVGVHDFLKPLITSGLKAVEFELHPNQAHWQDFPPLMESCHADNLIICFHAPYKSHYTIAGFSGVIKPQIEKDFLPMLELAESWADRQDFHTTVVVHPAKARNLQDGRDLRGELFCDTQKFLEWCCLRFPKLRFALENVGPAVAGETKIGDTREEILDLVNKVNAANLGICWDFGHDALHGRLTPPSSEWLAKVVHAHIHDLNDEGVDHFPLVYNSLPAQNWLRLLSEAGMEGVATLEIKGNQLTGWKYEDIQSSLVNSLEIIAGGNG